MGASVNSIPSINVPFIQASGMMNPIWYEFFRSFIAAAVEDTANTTTAAVTVTAGAGLTGGGAISDDITLTVGAGSGITVNADDVAVNITGQTSAQAAMDDEVMIADVSNSSAIRKTRIRDITALSSPGGSNTQIQYNDNSVFDGDSGFTTNGAGSVNIVGDLDVDNLNLNGSTLSDTVTSDDLVISTTGLNASTIVRNGGSQHTRFRIQSTTGVAALMYLTSDYLNGGSVSNPTFYLGDGNDFNRFSFLYNATAADRRLYAYSGNNIGWSLDVNGHARFAQHLTRSVTNTITASTTQTQGQGALTADINIVTTVANANDTVTLPAAYSTNTYTGGQRIIVINDGANTLKIFPASGDNLGEGANTATTLVSGATVEFISKDATNWEKLVFTGTVTRSVTATITASTTQTQGQGALTADINEISTCANANDTVTLPSATAGRYCLVINNGAQTLQVFPASGDNLGAGVDTATTIATTSRKMFVAFDTTNWEPVL